MAEPIRLVTRAEQEGPAAVAEKLHKAVAEVEGGKLARACKVFMVFEVDEPGDSAMYFVRTSGMTNAQAVWMLEIGKQSLLNGEGDDNG